MRKMKRKFADWMVEHQVGADIILAIILIIVAVVTLWALNVNSRPMTLQEEAWYKQNISNSRAGSPPL